MKRWISRWTEGPICKEIDCKSFWVPNIVKQFINDDNYIELIIIPQVSVLVALYSQQASALFALYYMWEESSLFWIISLISLKFCYILNINQLIPEQKLLNESQHSTLLMLQRKVLQLKFLTIFVLFDIQQPLQLYYLAMQHLSRLYNAHPSAAVMWEEKWMRQKSPMNC